MNVRTIDGRDKPSIVLTRHKHLLGDQFDLQRLAQRIFHFTIYFLQFRIFHIHAQPIVCYSDYA
jgi:hypothetical protein